jgi:hypothetical protein
MVFQQFKQTVNCRAQLWISSIGGATCQMHSEEREREMRRKDDGEAWSAHHRAIVTCVANQITGIV